jgi:hypothetical protein
MRLSVSELVCAEPVEPELVDPDELVLGAALVLALAVLEAVLVDPDVVVLGATLVLALTVPCLASAGS